MSISPIFNMTDLFLYQITFEPSVLPSSISASISSTPVPHALSIASESLDDILDFLDNEFVITHSCGYRHFLVVR